MVTRVYTPGSLYEEGLLEGDEQSLASVVTGPDTLGLAVLDASTGKLGRAHMTARAICAVADDLLRWQPSELVCRQKMLQTNICPPFFRFSMRP